jgi:hypothetical protein
LTVAKNFQKFFQKSDRFDILHTYYIVHPFLLGEGIFVFGRQYMGRSRKPTVASFDELAVFLAMNKIVWNRTRGGRAARHLPQSESAGFSLGAVDSPAIGGKRLRFLAEKVFQGYREAEMGEADHSEEVRGARQRLRLWQ